MRKFLPAHTTGPRFLKNHKKSMAEKHMNKIIVFGGLAALNGYESPLEAENIVEFIEHLLSYLFPVILILGVLLILFGAFVLITSTGLPLRKELGKKIIIWTLIGLALAIVAHGLIQMTLHIIGA